MRCTAFPVEWRVAPSEAGNELLVIVENTPGWECEWLLLPLLPNSIFPEVSGRSPPRRHAQFRFVGRDPFTLAAKFVRLQSQLVPI